MKLRLRKMLAYLSTFAASFAMAIAVQNVSSTCLFLAYQPEVPKELQEKRQ